MAVFPVIIDSKPAYLASGATPASLLLAPFGNGSLLDDLHERVSVVTNEPVLVLPAFDSEKDYEQAIRDFHAPIDAVVTPDRIRHVLSAHEPSDWLLMIDPRWFPADGFHLEELLEDVDHSRNVKHLISLDTSAEGTKEYIQLDEQGRVRKIQRFYQGVTWLQALGVSCSLIPVTSVRHVGQSSFSCLSALRKDLATIGIPSRDVSPDQNTIDLHNESGLLNRVEESVLEKTSAQPVGPYKKLFAGVHVGPGCKIDPSARIIGPVILQDGATVQAGAMIVGPALMGAGSRVGCNAVLAQGMLARNAGVPDGARVCHRVVSGIWSDSRDPITGITTGQNAAEFTVPRTVIGGAAAAIADMHSPSHSAIYPTAKRVVESVIAFLGLLALSPLMVLTAVLVKMNSSGPVLYGDKREGRGGKIFRCWKFRTMVVGAQDQQRALMDENKVDGPQFKLDDDPRVTRIGRWLRLTNIDELPQLINVSLGQMSLIGPRPSPFRENQICVPWRQARLSVRPGITGLWQVCRHERKAGDFHQWIYYDMLYVRHLSFWLDVKILLATLLTGGGRRSVSLSAMIPESEFADESDTSAITTWPPTPYPQQTEAAREEGTLASGMG